MLKNEKGITIISLIITIIILSILTTVTIMSLTDDKGLLSSVEKQKNDVLQTQAKQEIDVAIEKVKLENVNNKLTIYEFTGKLLEKLNNTSTQINVVSETEYNIKYNDYLFTYYYSI